MRTQTGPKPVPAGGAISRTSLGCGRRWRQRYRGDGAEGDDRVSGRVSQGESTVGEREGESTLKQRRRRERARDLGADFTRLELPRFKACSFSRKSEQPTLGYTEIERKDEIDVADFLMIRSTVYEWRRVSCKYSSLTRAIPESCLVSRLLWFLL